MKAAFLIPWLAATLLSMVCHEKFERSSVEPTGQNKIMFQQDQPFELVYVEYRTDYPSSDPDTSYCQNWSLSSTDIEEVLTKTSPITGSEWHYLFDHMPWFMEEK